MIIPVISLIISFEKIMKIDVMPSIVNRRLMTGEKLKNLRAEKHLKLEGPSKAVRISISTLSNYENDENYDISVVNILELAKYYDVSTDFLLGRTENRTGNRTEISELNLYDDTIGILKNKKKTGQRETAK